jgi:hypothetical protein
MKRDLSYTQFAVAIRSVRPDQSSVANSLHHVSNGNALLRFSWREDDECVIPSFKSFKLFTGEQGLEYLGNQFRVVLGLPEHWTNVQLGFWLINKMILIHRYTAGQISITNISLLFTLPVGVFSLAIHRFMLRKLFAPAAPVLPIRLNIKRSYYRDRCTA